MSTLPLEERVALLETEVMRLKRQMNIAAATPWWEQISGVFADTPAFNEVVDFGRQYREAQRPFANTNEDEDVSA
jgi:hypothetical protein